MVCAPPTPTSLRLLIADDHHIVRTALRALLQSCATIEIVGEARDGAEALDLALALKPDVMLLDLAMPRLNGIEVARRVTAACRKTRVLALTALEGAEYVEAACAAGALGYIPKSAVAPDLIGAIQTVAAGRRFVHPVALSCAAVPTVPLVADPTGLSAREADVVRFLALGYTSKEIALQLHVGVKSVETYKVRAAQKIGARNRADLVRFALVRGWIPTSLQPVARPVGNKPDARGLAEFAGRINSESG